VIASKEGWLSCRDAGCRRSTRIRQGADGGAHSTVCKFRWRRYFAARSPAYSAAMVPNPGPGACWPHLVHSGLLWRAKSSRNGRRLQASMMG
jgi:hypothetical protein